ncbi:MAG TPA: 3D domain-containing protein [Vicinamibacterales bacterium]|jgi:3D (Asp-Asp-Asp) domain-containing protein
MRISHSLWRKLVVTLFAAGGFVLVYQATILDSKYAARQALLREDKADPGPGTRLRFTASAYCTGDVTASGLAPRTGIAAADPDVLPTGSIIQISKLGAPYDGIYTIMDTGPVVRGRTLDIYTRNCSEATRFGRRAVQVFVLRLGWNPSASGPSLLDTLLPWRDKSKAKQAAPASRRPSPSTDLPQFPQR